MLANSYRLTSDGTFTVDFLYEYERPAGDVTSRGAIENYSDKRRLGHDDILYGFKRELDLFSSKKGAIMCQRDIESLREPISRIEAVLASARLEVVGMPSTNFVYPCRLILVAGDSRNLCEYARFCMDRVKERLADENWILVAKVVLHEYEMKQARRIVREMQMRIAGAETGAETGGASRQIPCDFVRAVISFCRA